MERCLFYRKVEGREVRDDGRVNTQLNVSCAVLGSKIPGCERGLEVECPLVSRLTGDRAYVAKNGYLPEEDLDRLIEAQKHRRELKIVIKDAPVPDFWEDY